MFKITKLNHSKISVNIKHNNNSNNYSNNNKNLFYLYAVRPLVTTKDTTK